MKTSLFVIVGLTIAFMLYPRYDLHVKENFFDQGFTVEATGFITSIGCHEKANEIKARYYTCEPKEIWRSLFLDEDAEQKSLEMEARLGEEGGLAE